MMMEPRSSEELPELGQVEHEVYKDERGVFGWWGRVVYDRPLTGREIDRYGLDGPVAYGWR
jgi:hypothetical protein